MPVRLATYLRSIGFISFVFAIGASLMEDYFWWFVCFTYAALVISIVDSVIERELRGYRFIPAAFYIAFLLFFTFTHVIGRVHPKVTVLWTEGNYTAGQNIDGLTWRDGWSQLTFSVFNDSKQSMKNIDTTLWTDESVANIKVVGDVKCSVIQSGVTAELTIRQGSHQDQMQSIGNQSPYRLLCDAIPANTGVQVVEALINTAPMQDLMSGNTTSLWGPKQMPSVVKYHFDYHVGPRPYSYDGQSVPKSY